MLIAAVAGCLLAATTARAVEYIVVDLGTLGGESAWATALNDNGQVVGVSEDASGEEVPFIWQAGEMTALEVPDEPPFSLYESCEPIAISNTGIVVGNCENAGSDTRGVMWIDGQIIDLGGISADGRSYVNDVNDDGIVAGNARTDTGQRRAVMGDSSGWTTVIGDLWDTWSRATCVNNDGEVAGYVTVYFGGGFPDDCNTVDGFVFNGSAAHFPLELSDEIIWMLPADILDDRTILYNRRSNWFNYCTGWVSRPIVRWRDGQLEFMSSPGSLGSVGVAMNNDGTIVGYREVEGDQVVWIDGQAVLEADLALDSPIGDLHQFLDINENGVIAARAFVDGEPRAILLVPAIDGDLDVDGDVDVQDLMILLGDWGPCPDCPADLDADGSVTTSDLLILLGEWG